MAAAVLLASPRSPSEPAGVHRTYSIFSDSEDEPPSGRHDRDEETLGRDLDPARAPRVQNLIDFEACSKVAAEAEVQTALLQYRLSVPPDGAQLDRAFEESRARDRVRVACMFAGHRDRQLQRDALLVWFLASRPRQSSLASRQAAPPRLATPEAAPPRPGAPEAALPARGPGLLAVGVPVAWGSVLGLWSALALRADRRLALLALPLWGAAGGLLSRPAPVGPDGARRRKGP